MHGKFMFRRAMTAVGLVVALTGVLAPGAAGGSPSATTSPPVARAASGWVWMGHRCIGREVLRCIGFQLNTGGGALHGKMRAVASRIDDNVSYPSNYTVAVNNVQLQWWDGVRWVTLRRSVGYDLDGWWATRDVAYGPMRYAFCGQAAYRGLAYFHWRGASPGDQWVASNTVAVSRVC